jgi:hypothetical protein
MDDAGIADRINRLERSNRRLKVWLILLTSVVLVGAFLKPYTILGNDFSGRMVGISMGSGTAVQGFWNTEKQRRLEFGVVKKGDPCLYLLGPDERVRLGLDLRPEPNVTLRDRDGAARIRMYLLADGSPIFSLTDASEKGGIFFGIRADGNPVLLLKDKDGNTLFQAPDPQGMAPDR